MKERKTGFFVQYWHSDRLLLSSFYAVISVLCGFTLFRLFYVQHKVFTGISAVFAVLACTFLLFSFFIKKSGSTNLAANKLRENKPVYLSLLLSSLLVFFIWAVYSLSPLGDYTVLRMDLYHQYGPLFAELYDRISLGKSLLYSWNSGGGSGFLGNFFNYLSSPFTLFIFWVSRKEVVTTGISIVIFAKCIAASGTFSYYLQKRFQDKSFCISAFALLYAFSAYFIAYYWNVMWLDAMVVLPLTVLGIERIIEKSHAKTYYFSLVFCFLTNYYMAYMICIFSVLYFLFYYAANHALTELYVPKTRDLPRFSYLRQSRFLCAGIRFAFASVLAALTCAAVLLPVYHILSGSSATGSDFPSEASGYFNIYDFLVSHFAALEPTIRSSGGDVTPNIYCGIISVLLFPLFLINKRFSWKEKLSTFLLLLVFFVSFNLNSLNFIWHGFHFPNDLPYRFSFMYSFILLVCAYKVFRYIRDYTYQTLIIIGGSMAFVVVAAQKFEFKFADDFTIYASLAFLAIYTLLICASISKKLSTVMTSVVLCCAVICEVLVCDVPKFEFGVRESDYVSDYDGYHKEIEKIQSEDSGFYRMELNDVETGLRMSPCWYNYEGMNCFSSMANEDYSNLQFNLGNFSNKINSFIYHNQTPVYNLMFNISYVIDNQNPLKLNSTYYRYLRGNQEFLTTYRNRYASSIAFCVDRAVLKGWKTEEYKNPFELQNEFLRLATGMEEDFFEKAVFYTNGAQNCSITSFDNETDGSLSLSVFDSDASANFSTYFKAEEKGNYYIYLGSTSLYDYAEIQTPDYNKRLEVDTEPYILDLGVLNAGEEVNIKTFLQEDCSGGNGYLWAYRFNDAAFKKAYRVIDDAGLMRVSEHSETYLKGKVSAKKDEILYTSIGYDDGWTCYVDGVQVKPLKLNNALLALEIGEGEHTVEFSFSPAGLKAGVLISACTVGCIVLFLLCKKMLIWLIAKQLDKAFSNEAVSS